MAKLLLCLEERHKQRAIHLGLALKDAQYKVSIDIVDAAMDADKLSQRKRIWQQADVFVFLFESRSLDLKQLRKAVITARRLNQAIIFLPLQETVGLDSTVYVDVDDEPQRTGIKLDEALAQLAPAPPTRHKRQRRLIGIFAALTIVIAIALVIYGTSQRNSVTVALLPTLANLEVALINPSVSVEMINELAETSTQSTSYTINSTSDIPVFNTKSPDEMNATATGGMNYTPDADQTSIDTNHTSTPVTIDDYTQEPEALVEADGNDSEIEIGEQSDTTSDSSNPSSNTATASPTGTLTLTQFPATTGTTKPDTDTLTPDAGESSDDNGVEPIVDFSVEPMTGNAPLTVTFTNTSTGSISAYAWDFDGDGEVDSTEANPPPHTYEVPGGYNIRLTIKSSYGEFIDIKRILVKEATTKTPEKMQARFSASPIDGSAPLTVSFVNESTGSISAYAWDFDGDGEIDSTIANPPPFTYTTLGIYVASLIVNDNVTESLPYRQTIRVEEPTAAPVRSVFSASALSGIAPLTVSFSNQSVGDISDYSWDFNGDGVTDSRDRNPPPYIYRRSGIYTVVLEVTGADDSESVANTIIKVNTAQPVQAQFATSKTSGVAPLTVNFSNQSTGTIKEYRWDFNGDGIPDSTTRNPSTYTYTQSGVYNVTLQVSGAAGDNSWALSTIHVRRHNTVVIVPTFTKTYTPTSTVTVRSTNTPLPTATHTSTATFSPTFSPTPTQLQSSTPAFTLTSDATISPLPGATFTPSPSLTFTPLPSATLTPLPTETFTPTPSATLTPSPSLTFTPLPSATLTPLPTETFTPTPSATLTPSPSLTFTPLPSATLTPLPPETFTPESEDTDQDPE